MQVILKNILKAYSGKCDGLIYYYHPGLDRLLCRRHTIPKRSESNQRFAEIAASLKALQPSEGFWMDLRHYAALVSVKGIYLKLLFQAHVCAGKGLWGGFAYNHESGDRCA